MISCGGVALDPFGAGVPGEHRALRVEHEDRVVDDAVDQQAEAMLLEFVRVWRRRWVLHPPRIARYSPAPQRYCPTTPMVSKSDPVRVLMPLLALSLTEK